MASKKADLNPQIGWPGGRCHVVDRIQQEVRDPRERERLTTEVEMGDHIDNEEADIIYDPHPERGAGIFPKLYLSQHMLYRMDLRNITVQDLRVAFQEFSDLFQRGAELLKEPSLRKPRLLKLRNQVFDWQENMAYGKPIEFTDSLGLTVVFKGQVKRGEAKLVTTWWEGLPDPRPVGEGACRVAARFLSAKSPTSGVWYHGSQHLFDEFTTGTRHTFGDRPSLTPLFFTRERAFAEAHAGYTGYLYTVKLRASKPFDGSALYKDSRYWPPEPENLTPMGLKLYEDLENNRIIKGLIRDDEDHYQELGNAYGTFASILKNEWGVLELPDMKAWMQKHGFDSFYLTGEWDGEHIAVFDPKDVEIVEVTPRAE